MKLSSSQLQAFHTVVKTRNFTKAAELLHISQSALSQRILNLEQELQTSLFIRSKSGIDLTPIANELFKYCHVQEKFEEEFLGKLKTTTPEKLVGIVRIAGPSTIIRSVIIPCLASLSLKHPQVQLHVLTKELYELPSLLMNGEVDYIVLDRMMEKNDIEALQLGLEKNVLIKKKKTKDIDVYLDHDEKDETTKRYLKLFGEKNIKMKRHFLDDIYGIIEGVKLGLGKAVVPKHLIKMDKLIEVENPKAALEIPVILHHHKHYFYTQLHNALLEVLINETSKILK